MTAPLVPPEVDLRDFAYMPLDVLRLRDSDLSAEATDAEFRAAVMLWCAAWHQVPAASLPDNDAVLTKLCGLGRDVASWQEIRPGALRGWVKCDDGRLYHPVVAEKANEAWEQRQNYRERLAKARSAKADKNRDFPHSVTEPITDDVTDLKGTERNGTERNLKTQTDTEFLSLSNAAEGIQEKEKLLLEFWEKFPKGKFASKPKARALFMGLSSQECRDVVSCLWAFSAHVRAKPPTDHPMNPDTFLRDRIWENFAAGAAPISDLVLIDQESPEGEAWEAFKRRNGGKGVPWVNKQWRLPTRWPPGHVPSPTHEQPRAAQ